jgi:hypothetical protein
MSTTARRIDPMASSEGAPALHEGRVVGTAPGGGLRVQAGPWVLDAARAPSCLVAPDDGDRVLVATVGREAFVIAVLAREGGGATTVATDGDLAIVARGGRVSVRGSEGVALAGAEVSATAPRITLASDALDLASRAVSLVADVATTRFGAAKLVARTADAVLDRVFLRAERSFRQIEALDQTRAGQVDVVAKDCALFRGEHTIVGADGLVKVDGEQVHIG